MPMAIDTYLTKQVLESLKDHRVVAVRIPAEEPYAGSLILPDYEVYYFDSENNKLRYTKPQTTRIIKLVSWLIKSILFVLQTIFAFPIAVTTIVTLASEFFEICKSRGKYDIPAKSAIIKDVSKHFHIDTKPRKIKKNIKKVLFFKIDGTSTREEYAAILLICDLVNKNYINNANVVIVSGESLTHIEQQPLRIEFDEIDNDFLLHFNRGLLEDLRHENYVGAADKMKKYLSNHQINDIIEFEFVMQCLAFCYQNLGINDFVELFKGLSLNVRQDISTGEDLRFIAREKTNCDFVKFCYKYLLYYYHSRPGVNNDTYESDFKHVVERVNRALISRNNYFAAAKLCAKFFCSNESVEQYIIAFLHLEYVSNAISDECLEILNSYASHGNDKAALFCRLYEFRSESETAETVVAMYKQVENLTEITSPLVKLCYFYYLVNPLYLFNCDLKSFMCEYGDLLDKLDDNDPLKCLFSAQFLLLYTTIENKCIRTKFAKRVSFALQYVMKRQEMLKNKKIYVKVCRALNGLRCDQFNKNLEDMLHAQDIAANYLVEDIYYKLNLGVMYVYRSNQNEQDYRKALEIYDAIDINLLCHLPIQNFLSYKNNRCVIEYLNQPNKRVAKQKYEEITELLKGYSSIHGITEEIMHLYINQLLFAMIIGLPQQVLESMFATKSGLLSSDKYFAFYFEQCKLLYSVLYGQPIKLSPTYCESVFFSNKKSFFEHKNDLMTTLTGKPKLETINRTLQEFLCNYDKDYEYFKRADLFSLVERWYE